MYASIANPTQDQTGRINPGQISGKNAGHTRPQNRTRKILTFPLLLIFSFFLLSFAFAPSGASAADYYVDIENGSNQTGNGSVGTPWRNITYALTQIVGTGHTIHLKAGVYDDTPDGQGLFEVYPIVLPQDCSIVGDDGASSTTLDAKGADKILQVSDSTTTVTVQGLKLTNGNSGPPGGAISIENSMAQVLDCELQYNTCSGTEGEALYCSNSSLDLRNTLIMHSNSGYALSIQSSSDVRMEGCSVTNNVEGIKVNFSNLTVLDRMTVSNNSSRGLHLEFSTVVFRAGLVLNNNGYVGIESNTTPIVLENAEISGNAGNGMYFSGGSSPYPNLVLRNCTFKDQRASAIQGGPMGDVTIESCTFLNNSTGGSGGGVNISAAASLNFHQNILRRNSAAGLGGGAQFNNITRGAMSYNSFLNNASNSSPAALQLRVHAANSFIVHSNTFSGNTGIHCIYYWGNTGTTIEFSNNIVSDNDCIASGLFMSQNNVGSIKNNYICNNQGMGMYIESSPGNLTDIVNNTVSNNAGRGITLGRDSSNIVNNVISGNSDIGIVENNTGGDAFVSYNFIYNNAGGLFRDEGQTTYFNLALLESSVSEVGNNLDSDPLFMDAAAGIYHIQSGSPARNAGTTIAGLTEDWDGEPRPEGAAYDIGADEYHAAHSADDNEDRIIDNWEMLRQVDLWAASTITQLQLDAIRVLWRSLRGYRSDGAGGFVAR